jgi:hypothetical protein
MRFIKANAAKEDEIKNSYPSPDLMTITGDNLGNETWVHKRPVSVLYEPALVLDYSSEEEDVQVAKLKKR